jgi:hypothetical protein
LYKLNFIVLYYYNKILFSLIINYKFIHTNSKLTFAVDVQFSVESPSNSTRALAATAAFCSLYETSPVCKALISDLFAISFSDVYLSVTSYKQDIIKLLYQNFITIIMY